uniref:Uncharacterized protein n=1 Tax=Chelonoidis abingdonii TaxID=106734 RepID=A0A8C0H8M5_CHEAB
MGLFQGALINMLFANKEPSNLSFKISVGVIMQQAVKRIYSAFCSKETNYLLLSTRV